MGDSPQVGQVLSVDDLEEIFTAVRGRIEKHPHEPPAVSFFTVISNIGERYRSVQCLEQEWTGTKADIPPGEGDPKCPNGHSLHAGPGIAIGWVPVE